MRIYLYTYNAYVCTMYVHMYSHPACNCTYHVRLKPCSGKPRRLHKQSLANIEIKGMHPVVISRLECPRNTTYIHMYEVSRSVFMFEI